MDITTNSESTSAAVCSDCGVDVRDGSQYCYNCGHANAVLETPHEISDSESTQSRKNGFQTNGPRAIKENAATRRRPRTSLRPSSNEPVQVVWEQRQDSGVGFLIVSLAAGIVALLLIFIAYFLK